MTWNDPPRRLVRRREGKVLAGVCSGLADYLGVDVNLVRVLTVVLGVMTGAILPAYLLAWLIVPEEGAERSEVERLIDRMGWGQGRHSGPGHTAGGEAA
jgi:phage shock protein PspC (stress-responsive transcriptional regulator)